MKINEVNFNPCRKCKVDPEITLDRDSGSNTGLNVVCCPKCGRIYTSTDNVNLLAYQWNIFNPIKSKNHLKVGELNMAALYSPERMFTFIKGMACALNWKDTLTALYIAREAHDGQTRKSGEPYIIHPLTVACHAISLGMREDLLIASCLLHDWEEDCGGKISTLPCSPEVKETIDLVTFRREPGIDKGSQLSSHYSKIAESRLATFVKLFDRANNVSTMAGVFTPEKIREYIDETRTYVLPLQRHAKNTYHEQKDADALFTLKYHITSVIDAIEATKDVYKVSSTTEDEKETGASGNALEAKLYPTLTIRNPDTLFLQK